MSEENVEVVRTMFADFRERGLTAVLDYADPEIVWNAYEEREPARGAKAVKACLERWEDAWDELETIPEEFVDAGDRVVVRVRHEGRGRASGIDYEAWSYQVF
jgi:ketosteroid isomerase-like protein